MLAIMPTMPLPSPPWLADPVVGALLKWITRNSSGDTHADGLTELAGTWLDSGHQCLALLGLRLPDGTKKDATKKNAITVATIVRAIRRHLADLSSATSPCSAPLVKWWAACPVRWETRTRKALVHMPWLARGRPPLLTPEEWFKREEAQRLLRMGQSVAAVARMVGLSRPSIDAIRDTATCIMDGQVQRSDRILLRRFRSGLRAKREPQAIVEELIRDSGLPQRVVLQYLVWGLRRRPESARQLLLEVPVSRSGRPAAASMTADRAQHLVNDLLAGPWTYLPEVARGTPWTNETFAAFLGKRGIQMKPAVAVRQLGTWGALIHQPDLTLRRINATMSHLQG